MKQHFLILCLMALVPLSASSQNQIVSYAYDQAGNRISRKIVDLSVNPNPTHVKKSDDPAPIEDQLGERKIAIYPNPTKGMLGVEITGGEAKDAIRIQLFNADGKQLQNKKAESGITPLNLTAYPTGWYILRVQAGEKMTEFKIVKQ